MTDNQIRIINNKYWASGIEKSDLVRRRFKKNTAYELWAELYAFQGEEVKLRAPRHATFCLRWQNPYMERVCDRVKEKAA